MSNSMYYGLRNHISRHFSADKFWTPITEVKTYLSPCGEICRWQLVKFDQVVKFGGYDLSCLIIAKRVFAANGEIAYVKDVCSESWVGPETKPADEKVGAVE